MSRTVPNRPIIASLILITSQLLACSSRVELGQTKDAGTSQTGGGGGIDTTVGGGSSTGGASVIATGGATSSFTRLASNAITGIDLLLMIDNSASMADKQATLAAAVPQLLGQLIQPKCVDASGNSLSPPVAVALGAANPCAAAGAGFSPEFNPVNNIHIGIVTSSLGDHGANTLCTPGAATQYTDPNTSQPILQPPDVNDMGHMVGTLARATAAQGDAQTTYATLNAQGCSGSLLGVGRWTLDVGR